MRVPRMTVINRDEVPAQPRVVTPGAPVPPPGPGVKPKGIDIGCVLSTAAGCFFQCGLDVGCLLSCAPGLAKCIS
jgi:hypothetical protein